MKRLPSFACLLLCLGCLVFSLASLWVPADPVPLFSPTLPRATETPQAVSLLLDGVTPVQQLSPPPVQTSPQPGRDWAPVEEIALSGGEPVANFTVKDSTGSGVDLLEELSLSPAVSLKKDGSPEILIYHTHTSEAYSAQYTGFTYLDAETRTADPAQSVVAVGEALKAALEAQGYGVIHDTTVNDALYNGSYSRSWEVIQHNLEQYPTLQVTIDLHRDSMTTDQGVRYKPTVEVAGRKAAQFMLLAGCDWDESWGDFPDWEQNLRLMLRVQQAAEQLYPGLARPLSFSNSKYNMNATPGSMLIEVGTEVSTVSEARYTGKLLGEILSAAFDSL